MLSAPFGAQDLQLRLLDLDVEHLDLVDPVLQPPVPASLGQIERRRGAGDVGEGVADARKGLEETRQLGADRDLHIFDCHRRTGRG